MTHAKRTNRVLSRGFVLLLALAFAVPVAPATVTSVAAQDAPLVKEYDISAIDVVLTVNRFGDHDPGGKMYVLDENIPAVRAQERRPLPDRVSTGLREDPIQPLVIRANIGDRLVINFTNRLASGRASIHMNGVPLDPATSAGSFVGRNPDTTVAPGESIRYEWQVPDQRNMEGSYVFMSLGSGIRDLQVHGLFGVLNIEPKGSVYLSPITGEPLKSGWEAMIVDPNGKDFREDTIIYHELGDETFRLLDKEGSRLPLNDPLNEDAYRPGSRLLNYRSEPFMNRQLLVEEVLDHPDQSQNYGSYMFGDPPTPMPRGYVGDPTKRRIVHAGSERFHVEHLHGGSIRWQFDPFMDPEFFGLPGPDKDPPAQTASQRLDSQSIGPLEAYTAAIEGGAGGLQAVAGEFLFHCHFGHHYVVGMWSFWRVFDTFQTAEPWQIDPRNALQEIPDRRGRTPRAVDSTQLVGLKMPSGRTLSTGSTTNDTLNIDEWLRTKLPPQGDPGQERAYDASVWNWVRVDSPGADPLSRLGELGFAPASSGPLYLSEPETTRIWPNYRSPAPGERLPIMFNPTNGRPAFPLLRPHLGRRPPFSPMRSGSPYLGDPVEGFPQEHPDSLIPAGARRLEYVVVATPVEVEFNSEFGIENDDGALPVLDEEKEDILAGVRPREQLTIRANVGDGVDIIHYSEASHEQLFEFSKSNLHFHFVQFDTQGSDGVITGLSYEQSVQSYRDEGREGQGIRLSREAPAGSTAITVNDASTLKVNAFLGIGFGIPRRNRDGGNLPGSLNRQGGFEWVQIVAKDGNTLVLDRPLENNHPAGHFVGTEFVRQQLYADAESGTTYFHNHVFAIPGFGLALTAALIQEPRGSTWHDPATGAPLRSGAIADIKNVTVPVAPGIPIQGFREYVLHFMNAATGIGEGEGGEPGAVNMKQEPLKKRLSDKGDPSLVFSSVTHGDPETPLLRAYVGDLGVIRLLNSSGHDTASFSVAGHRFRLTRFDPLERPKETVPVGISERFDLFFTAGSVGLQPGDYVYMNGMHEKLLDGAWGVLRVHDTLQPDLQPIQQRFPLPAVGARANESNTGGPAPKGVEPKTVEELQQKLERAGYQLPEDMPVRTYDVVAIEVDDIVFSDDLKIGHGRAFVLAEVESAIKQGVKTLEPLVLRANVGEIVRINFTNHLKDARASFHIANLIHTADSGGDAFGLNNDSTTAPGETRTQWYVIDPRFEVPRSMHIMDFGDIFEGAPGGLYGAFVTEPAGSTYHDPETGQEVKSGAVVDVHNPSLPAGGFRDAVLVLHDDDHNISRDIMPYRREVRGVRGVNYRAEPFEERFDRNEDSSKVLSSSFHTDPRTPLIRALVGDPVRIHVIGGFGHQTHVFTLDGHRFPFEPSGPDKLNLYARALGALGVIDAVLEGGAGGLSGKPGDYVYRDGRNPFFEGGLWGIMRVSTAADAGLQPLPGRGLELDMMGAARTVPVNFRTGVTEQDLEASSPDGMLSVVLPQGARMVGREQAAVKSVGAHWSLGPEPVLSDSQAMIGPAARFWPQGAKIAPAARLVFKYQPDRLPPGASQSNLFVAEWDGVAWKAMPSIVDAATKTVTAEMDALETYALMVGIAPDRAAAGQARWPGTGWLAVAGWVLAGALGLSLASYFVSVRARERARRQ